MNTMIKDDEGVKFIYKLNFGNKTIFYEALKMRCRFPLRKRFNFQMFFVLKGSFYFRESHFFLEDEIAFSSFQL